MRLERQPAHLGEAGRNQAAAAGDDPKAHALADALRALAGAEAGDDQRLIGLGDPPADPEQERQQQQTADDDGDQDDRRSVVIVGNLIVSVGATSTVRPPRLPTTRTWVCLRMVAVLVGGAGQEALGACADLDHHLAEVARGDVGGHSRELADHVYRHRPSSFLTVLTVMVPAVFWLES